MNLNKVLSFIVIIYGFHRMINTLSFFTIFKDLHMEVLIKESLQAYENITSSNQLLNLRCPYYYESYQYKINLINKGYVKKFYSERIRNELISKQLYPMFTIDSNGDIVIKYFCKFKIGYQCPIQ